MMKNNSEFLHGIESLLATKPSKSLWIVPSAIGGLVVAIILWLTISEVDVIAPSLGKTVPSAKMLLIQPKSTSIIKEIKVINGQSVKKGDVLVEFTHNIESYDNKSMLAKYYNLKGKKHSLNALIDYLSGDDKLKLIKDDSLPENIISIENKKLLSEASSYDTDSFSLTVKVKETEQEKEVVNAEISKLEKLLPYSKHKVEQVRPLVEKGLESENVLEDLEKEYLEQQENILIKKAQKSKLESQIEMSKVELVKHKNSVIKEYINKFTEVSNELNVLDEDLKKNNYILNATSIKAPVDGMVYNLKQHTIGEVLQSGDVIMELIPYGSPLNVQAKVLNRDIGFVHEGQKVNVKLDSFKFTKYGYIEGVITSVEKASILDEELGDVYPITVKLNDNKIKVNDKYIQLIPGMTCSVDIKISKRHLIDYIISPMIRYQDEALKER